MTSIDVGRMIPGTDYRVVHRQKETEVTHEGRYVGREVTATGDVLVFEPLPVTAEPVFIAVVAVIDVETFD